MIIIFAIKFCKFFAAYEDKENDYDYACTSNRSVIFE